MNDKATALRIIKLLSALESWGFSNKAMFPEFLHEELCSLVDKLSEEVLK